MSFVDQNVGVAIRTPPVTLQALSARRPGRGPEAHLLIVSSDAQPNGVLCESRSEPAHPAVRSEPTALEPPS